MKGNFRIIAVVVGIILSVLFLCAVGADNLFSIIKILLIWSVTVFAARITGHFISGIVEMITGEDHLYKIQVIWSAIIIAGLMIWAWYEKSHYFMGDLGAFFICVLFIIPVAVHGMIWLIKMVIHKHTEQK